MAPPARLVHGDAPRRNRGTPEADKDGWYIVDLAGKACIVTGGASGLGAATAQMLTDEGASVGIVDLASSDGETLAKELGDAAQWLPTDVRDPDQVAQAVDAVADACGGLHLCVNAAGVADAARVISRNNEAMFPLDTYRRVIDINLVGLFDVIRNTARRMAQNEPTPDGERGVIVNVASIAGFDGQAGQAAYSASKGAVIAMTLPLARELSSWGSAWSPCARARSTRVWSPVSATRCATSSRASRSSPDVSAPLRSSRNW